MKKTIGLLLLVLVVLGGLLYMLRSGSDDPYAEVPETVLPDQNIDLSKPLPEKDMGFKTGLENLPRSLVDTEVDGELLADANGHLVISNGVRRVFDYFLSTLGEESLDSVVARIRAYIRNKLPQPAAAEAEDLLNKYLAFMDGLRSLQQVQPASDGNMDLDAIRRQMNQVQALRQQYFSPEVVEAFFGDEDVYNSYMLDRVGILQDSQLTEAQRASRLSALEQQLPAELRESIALITKVQNLEALTADWKARGGSDYELRVIRENLVGEEAANRLEQLDQKNAAWDKRMSAWYTERDAILNNKNLSESDRNRQVEELRNSQFSESERTRVESLERMRDRGEDWKK